MPVPYAIRRERFVRIKKAFEETLGNPYGYPEPFGGHYQVLKGRSTLRAINVEIAAISVNGAKPNTNDYLIDCDLAIEAGLKQLAGNDPQQFKELLKSFISTYITEDGTSELDKKDRTRVEQAIGKLFIKRKISPIASYFETIRKKGY